MIMPGTSDQLLMPVKPWFLGLTLLLAFALNLVPMGRVPAMPDFVAVVLVFWIVHEPQRIGVGIGFALGLLMDVHDGAVLGQHALAYTLLSFLAVTVHRRLSAFHALSQMFQVLPLLLAAHVVALTVRMFAGGTFPGWSLLLAPVFGALLWPLADRLLLAPQRRPPDRDQNRPLL
jgi:rod shape-determining protein MreD